MRLKQFAKLNYEPKNDNISGDTIYIYIYRLFKFNVHSIFITAQFVQF